MLINKSKDVTILCIGIKKRNILQIFPVIPWLSWGFEIHVLQSPVTEERDMQAWRLGTRHFLLLMLIASVTGC